MTGRAGGAIADVAAWCDRKGARRRFVGLRPGRGLWGPAGADSPSPRVLADVFHVWQLSGPGSGAIGDKFAPCCPRYRGLKALINSVLQVGWPWGREGTPVTEGTLETPGTAGTFAGLYLPAWNFAVPRPQRNSLLVYQRLTWGQGVKSPGVPTVPNGSVMGRPFPLAGRPAPRHSGPGPGVPAAHPAPCVARSCAPSGSGRGGATGP